MLHRVVWKGSFKRFFKRSYAKKFSSEPLLHKVVVQLHKGNVGESGDARRIVHKNCRR